MMPLFLALLTNGLSLISVCGVVYFPLLSIIGFISIIPPAAAYRVPPPYCAASAASVSPAYNAPAAAGFMFEFIASEEPGAETFVPNPSVAGASGIVVPDLGIAIKFYTEIMRLQLIDIRERDGMGISQVLGYENTHIKIPF